MIVTKRIKQFNPDVEVGGNPFYRHDLRGEGDGWAWELCWFFDAIEDCSGRGYDTGRDFYSENQKQ